jgi:quercetin dioxygenase-like cupin family protein
MHLEANGIVGFHQAVISQLLIVVDGEGWVRSDNELKINIKANDIVFWGKGEGHETETATGLTAIVIESEGLTPTNFMPIKEHK